MLCRGLVGPVVACHLALILQNSIVSIRSPSIPNARVKSKVIFDAKYDLRRSNVTSLTVRAAENCRRANL
jgi:hypothetical protein